MNLDINLYIIRSKAGKYFRARGQHAYKDRWVDDINEAKVYTKLSTARSQVTYWATHWSQYGIPDLLKLEISGMTVLDEEKRVEDSKKKIKKKEDIRKARIQEWERQQAEIQLKNAQEVLNQF